MQDPEPDSPSWDANNDSPQKHSSNLGIIVSMFIGLQAVEFLQAFLRSIFVLLVVHFKGNVGGAVALYACHNNWSNINPGDASIA